MCIHDDYDADDDDDDVDDVDDNNDDDDDDVIQSQRTTQGNRTTLHKTGKLHLLTVMCDYDDDDDESAVLSN